MYHEIQVIMSWLVAKAKQLIDNVTTNMSESCMHVKIKPDGGKVINRSQSGLLEHCCICTTWEKSGDLLLWRRRLLPQPKFLKG